MDNEEIVLPEVGRQKCRLKAISYVAKIQERRTKDCLVIKGRKAFYTTQCWFEDKRDTEVSPSLHGVKFRIQHSLLFATLEDFLVISPKLGSSSKYVYICILKSCSSNLLYRTILSGSLCELSDHCYAAGFSVNDSNLNQQEKSIDRTYCVSCLSLTVPKI